MKGKTSELARVALNVMFLRFDSFLQNCIDFIYIGSLILYMHVQGRSLFVITDLTSLVVFSHFLYSVTYIINDYINYEDDFVIKSVDLGKYSFYRYRPIQYFGKRSIHLFIFIYVAYTFVFWYFFSSIITVSEIILLIVLYSLLSIFESLSKKKSAKKRLSFLLQLYSKYTVFTVLVIRCLGVPFSLSKIMDVVVCFSPYVFYKAFQDVLSNILLKHEMKGDNNKGFVYVMVSIFMVITLATLIRGLSNPSIIMTHLMITSPFIILVIIVPSLILGVQDKTVHDLYKRLGLKFLLVLLLLLMVLKL